MIILYRATRGGEMVANASRADYFKQRRETRKNFSVLIDKNKAIENINGALTSGLKPLQIAF